MPGRHDVESRLLEQRSARRVDDDRVDGAAIGTDDKADAHPALLATTHLAVRELGRRLFYGRAGNAARIHFHIERLRVCRRNQQS
jgi:hypothetical protein